MPTLPRKRKFDQSFSKADTRAVYHSMVSAIRDHNEAVSTAEAAIKFIKDPTQVSFEAIFSDSAFDATSESDFYAITQIQAFFKKRSDLELNIDTAGEAWKAFVKSEEICRSMNRVLESRSDTNSRDRAVLLFEMQRKITSILGPVPNYDDIAFGFGPGSNVGCNKNTSVRMKLSADATSTVGAFSLLQGDEHMSQTWPGLLKATAVRGSSWTTVPKTSLTDRPINIEPIVNSYLQKGYGDVIRRRLKKAGVDLNDQTRNQRLAREGSLTGALATIDLSMASDTIAYNLVRDLLPWDWFSVLDKCRSPYTQLPDGAWWPLQKFSSMGNGYTFELESLIFFALLLCVCGEEEVVSVYGDDLICPTHRYAEVINALSLLGFVPNSAKSFGFGPFRESCGKDYWAGIDVRPVFCKEAMSVKELYRLHNFFKRTGRMEYLLPVILKHIRKDELLFGPDGFGDGHLISDSLTYVVDKRQWDGRFVRFKTWQSIPRIYMSSRKGDYGAFLYLSRNGLKAQVSLKTLYAERSLEANFQKRTLYVRVNT